MAGLKAIYSHIVATAQDGGIGLNNELPWNIPEDMAFFRQKTKGHILIMGRKTFESFQGRFLPQRYHIVISREDRIMPPESPGVFVKSLQLAMEYADTLLQNSNLWPEEIFIIGGGEIYKQSLPYTQQIYLTEIYKKFPVDTYYPQIDSSLFTCIEKIEKSGPIPFAFKKFIRKEI